MTERQQNREAESQKNYLSHMTPATIGLKHIGALIGVLALLHKLILFQSLQLLNMVNREKVIKTPSKNDNQCKTTLNQKVLRSDCIIIATGQYSFYTLMKY